MFSSGFLIFLKTPNPSLSSYIIKLVIFNTEKLQQICKKNEWNLCGLLLIQLKIGLHYHDLGLIKKCLKHLTSEYVILAIVITLDYISSIYKFPFFVIFFHQNKKKVVLSISVNIKKITIFFIF